MTGSHIDTVPEGGPLDGALGVLAGLECLQTIHEAGVAHAAAAHGRGLERRGGPLRQPLRLAGLHRQARRQADPAASAPPTASGSWTPWRAPGFDACDAPKARCDPQDARAPTSSCTSSRARTSRPPRIPIGVVEGIVGIRRNWVTFIGQADHAGTTPMAWRKDAFLAAAEYALRRARAHRDARAAAGA